MIKKLKNQGFAISGVLYPILVLVVFLIVQMLTMLGTRKIILDNNRNQLVDALDTNNKVYTNEELSALVSAQAAELKRLSNYAETPAVANLNSASETSEATMGFDSNTTGKPGCTSGMVQNIGYGSAAQAGSGKYWQYQIAYCTTGEVFYRYRKDSTSTSAWSVWANDSYPIGSIYITIKDTNPSSYLGGTWVAFGTGRTLVGVDTSQTEFETVEKTGGEKTHKLTVSEMPAHSHRQYVTANSGGSGIRNDYNADARGGLYDQGINTGSAGGNGAHNNLQPYITVYMWKRTA